MWAFQGDRSRAVRGLERAIEHRLVLRLQLRRAFDRVLLVDVLDDRLDLRLAVTQGPQGQRHRLIDDLQHPAAGKLLVLHQGDVRLDARRVAIHHEADRAGGRQDRRLGVAEAEAAAADQHFVPEMPGGVLQILGTMLDLLDLLPVHFHDVQHRLAVLFVTLERPDRGGQLGAGAAGRAVQQGRHRSAQPAGFVGVVGNAAGHDQAAQVRVAQPQRPEAMAVGGNPRRRVAGVVDQDFLGDEHQPAGRLEALEIERAVLAAELHQVDAGQVAGRVVQEHVLGAGVRGVDPPRLRAGVPAVDRACRTARPDRRRPRPPGSCG